MCVWFSGFYGLVSVGVLLVGCGLVWFGLLREDWFWWILWRMATGSLVGCDAGGSFWLVWVVCGFVGLEWWARSGGWFCGLRGMRIVSVVIVAAVRLSTLLGMVVLRGLADWFAFDC